jgi:hypothetical protein
MQLVWLRHGPPVLRGADAWAVPSASLLKNFVRYVAFVVLSIALVLAWAVVACDLPSQVLVFSCTHALHPLAACYPLLPIGATDAEFRSTLQG